MKKGGERQDYLTQWKSFTNKLDSKSTIVSSDQTSFMQQEISNHIHVEKREAYIFIYRKVQSKIDQMKNVDKEKSLENKAKEQRRWKYRLNNNIPGRYPVGESWTEFVRRTGNLEEECDWEHVKSKAENRRIKKSKITKQYPVSWKYDQKSPQI